MPTDPAPITLFQVVKRACDVVDPDDEDAIVGDFERAFEDDDEPIRAVDEIEERVGEVLADLDPATNNGSLSVAAAIVVYLSFRRDELQRRSRPAAAAGRPRGVEGRPARGGRRVAGRPRDRRSEREHRR